MKLSGRTFFSVATLAAWLLFSASTAPAAVETKNLIRNGDFEEAGTPPPGWKIMVSPGESYELASNALTGKKTLIISLPVAGSVTVLSEPCAVTAGNDYLLTFWTRGEGTNANGGINQCYVIWRDANGKDLSSLSCHGYGPQPDYRAVTFTMTAPVDAAAAVLKYAARVGPDYKGPATAFLIDHVRLMKLAKVSLSADAPKWEYLNRAQQSGLKLVDDKQAANGQALVAEPAATPKNTFLAFGPYVNDQPVGEYLAVFRLKVKDNTRKEPVVLLDVSAVGNFNYTLAGPKTVSASDFKQAGVYQDVAFRFVRPDEGALEFRVAYLGSTDVSYDKVTVIQLTPFRTDREQTAIWLGESGSLPPAVAMTPSTAASTNNTVLVLAGLGHRMYFPTHALPKTLTFTYSYLAKITTGTVMDQPFPKNQDALKGVRLIVLADVPASALNGLMGRRTLRTFVENGGSLLVFGGPFAFGKGEYADSAFEPVLPITTQGPWDLAKTKSGVVKIAKTSPITNGLPWDEKPVVCYYQKVMPAAGTETLLECDGFPVLVTGRYGKGRVAVFAGTYLGEPAKGNVLLYEWSGYPELLTRVQQWLLNR